MKKFAFFKGCFIPIRLPHLERVSEMVFKDLDIELVKLDDFSCCPEPIGFGLNDKLTWLTLAARNIAIAEEKGLDILTICNGCYYTLKQTDSVLKGNKELKDKVNDIMRDTGHRFEGAFEIKHFVHAILEDIGLEKLGEKVKHPLKEIKVACHTGCHLISPVEIFRFDDQYDPVILERMVSALGASVSDYDLKTLCCGWTLSNYGSKASASNLIRDKLKSMKKTQADCITVTCPQCFYQFDTGQAVASRSYSLGFSLPVLFYPQLLGLALGYKLDEVFYERHRVKSSAFEAKLEEMLE
ncbi:CoB--CoM heterodisulfide reductase iron-sulfur subunit B family protein [Candidatus Bathyarchaeota archaeon]|nr:CoB--CoM heterodisulfide reductase iron-sulfur subunit B family protein [Candidatus Bathyarchaeota archaeon]MBS7630893.1 CoB--CoM heterodisulfide reductase iron-sulfur subunit B family protein [Candidatus Bathyarchaeota archaeon]